MKDADLKFNLKYQHLIKSHSLNDVIYLMSLNLTSKKTYT